MQKVDNTNEASGVSGGDSPDVAVGLDRADEPASERKGATGRRLVLYGAAVVVIGALGFFTVKKRQQTEADLIGTLQSGGEMLARIGDYETAEAKAREILKIDPENTEAILLLACIEQRRGNFDRAITLYRDSASRVTSVECEQYIRATIVDLFRQKKDYGRAATGLADFRNKYGETGNYRMIEGWLRHDQGDIFGAIESFDKARKIDPPHAGAHEALIHVAAKAEKAPLVREVLEDAADRDIKLVNLWYRVAVARRGAGEKAGVTEALQKSFASSADRTLRLMKQNMADWDGYGHLLPSDVQTALVAQKK